MAAKILHFPSITRSTTPTKTSAVAGRPTLKIVLDPKIAHKYRLYAAARSTEKVKVRAATVMAYALEEWMENMGSVVLEEVARSGDCERIKRICQQADAGA